MRRSARQSPSLLILAAHLHRPLSSRELRALKTNARPTRSIFPRVEEPSWNEGYRRGGGGDGAYCWDWQDEDEEKARHYRRVAQHGGTIDIMEPLLKQKQ